jgi:hypothetical protein
VLLDDALAQVQPETEPGGRPVAVSLHESIENVVAPLDWHADAVVADRNERVARPRHAQRDLDRGVRGAELERVVDQVRQHLLDTQRVQADLNRPRRIKRHLAFGMDGSRQIHDVHDHLAQIGL